LNAAKGRKSKMRGLKLKVDATWQEAKRGKPNGRKTRAGCSEETNRKAVWKFSAEIWVCQLG